MSVNVLTTPWDEHVCRVNVITTRTSVLELGSVLNVSLTRLASTVSIVIMEHSEMQFINSVKVKVLPTLFLPKIEQ